MMVDTKLQVSLQRADELLNELQREYNSCLQTKKVSDRAEQLTHEVIERLRSVLDRLARRYWTIHISNSISEEDRERASVYFPITGAINDFDSVLGRWRWKTVRSQHENVYQWLLARQPFQSGDNKWLAILNDLAAHGKHIDLVPQKTVEERRTTVTGPSGVVSWGEGVRFAPGVHILGAPVDPLTQRVIPTPKVTEKVEIWVSFVIESHGINALAFCKDAVREIKLMAEEMSAEFGL